MIFVVGYSDGHEFLSSESLANADEVLEAERKCQEGTDGNLAVVLIRPALSFECGQWVVRYGNTEKFLQVDYQRSPSWSVDGVNWESVYHAIERAFQNAKNDCTNFTPSFSSTLS